MNILRQFRRQSRNRGNVHIAAGSGHLPVTFARLALRK